MAQRKPGRRVTSKADADEQTDNDKKGAKQSVVVKRVFRKENAEHSGSWKVAFADFATAMMAFFLTMWLMGATTATERGGISQYFNNPSMVVGASPSPNPSVVPNNGGASHTVVQMGSDVEIYPSQDKPDAGDVENFAKSTKQDLVNKDVVLMVIDGEADNERQRLHALKSALEQVIEHQPSLKQYAEHIRLDLTTEGLRIQMIDKENRSMFPLGSADLESFGADVLEQLAPLIATVPNHISIAGHTDSRPYQRRNYSNWELSIDRANAARRALLAGGLPEDKIGRVVGLSAFAPLDRLDPQDPINRRISIIVLNKRTEKAIVQESGSLLGVQTELEQSSGL